MIWIKSRMELYKIQISKIWIPYIHFIISVFILNQHYKKDEYIANTTWFQSIDDFGNPINVPYKYSKGNSITF